MKFLYVGKWWESDVTMTGAWRRRVEIAVAFVLVTAVVFKAVRPSTDDISALGIQSHATSLLMEGELLLGIWLLLGGAEHARFVVAICSFTALFGVATYEALRGRTSCGCFGTAKVPPYFTAGLDFLIVLMLWVTRPGRNRAMAIAGARARVLLFVAAALVASVALWTAQRRPNGASTASLAQQDDGLILLEPATWLNRPLPVLDDIRGANVLRTGRWIVLLYHHDCDSCLKGIPAYRMVSNRNKIAFVQIPPLAVGDD